MLSYRALLLLPDPLFIARFMAKDDAYRKRIAKVRDRGELKRMVAQARRELSNLIMIQEHPHE